MTKILVIEDVHHLRNDVVEMLGYEGYEVAAAENGRVGVELAKSFAPDLIICDIMMPELDGYQVLEAIRSDPATVATPFIFLTAKTDRLDIREGMNKGAEDYLTKPFSTSELLETIRARLQRLGIYREIADAELNTLRTNITSALPHELRTPLNTIIGFSDLMMMEASTIQAEQVTEWATHINQAALRLYRLVENYLTYVRIETISQDKERLQSLRSKKTDMPDTVIEFQAVSRAQQVKREHDLVLNVVHPIPPLAISEVDLNKIIDELLDNAFKFSQPGTPVKLDAEVVNRTCVIRIRDEGHGMDKEQIDKIGAYMQFNRWFYEQQGTGLGLTISKRLAELHNGTLIVESALDKGTTVTITLQFA